MDGKDRSIGPSTTITYYYPLNREQLATLSRVLNGHSAISPDMVIRLEKAGWSSADFWLSRQTAYDLAQARKGEDGIQAKRYQPLPVATECKQAPRPQSPAEACKNSRYGKELS